MTKSGHHPIDKELRSILENLANGIFPLKPWIEDKDKRKVPPPDDSESLSWRRKGAGLTPNDLGAIDFFEHLLGQSEEDLQLLERWEEIEQSPLKHFHLKDPTEAAAWRAARALEPKTQFGVLESENTLVDVDERPVVRLHFYDAYWPLLREAVHKRKPGDWVTFAAELFKDQCREWPAGQPLKSSTLIFQFGRDLLHAMMNMENPAKPPWKHALLIELGERRRVGNEWTRLDAQRAVEEFEHAYSHACAEERPAAAVEQPAAPTDIPPIGTPPQKPYKGRRSPLVRET